MAAWDQKLLAVLKGDARPASAAEYLDLAFFSRRYERQHLGAVGLYAEGFRSDPKLAADITSQYRLSAGYSAALAASGQGEDAKLLPDKPIVMLRRQALRWLRADLELYAKLI
jgi:hypothetical protein